MQSHVLIMLLYLASETKHLMYYCIVKRLNEALQQSSFCLSQHVAKSLGVLCLHFILYNLTYSIHCRLVHLCPTLIAASNSPLNFYKIKIHIGGHSAMKFMISQLTSMSQPLQLALDFSPSYLA